MSDFVESARRAIGQFGKWLYYYIKVTINTKGRGFEGIKRA
jgi:hypothetical protein